MFALSFPGFDLECTFPYPSRLHARIMSFCLLRVHFTLRAGGGGGMTLWGTDRSRVVTASPQF